MEMAPTDRQAVRARTRAEIRASAIPIGDVVTLAGLLDDVLAACGRSPVESLPPVELLDAKSLPVFMSALDAAFTSVLHDRLLAERSAIFTLVQRAPTKLRHSSAREDSVETVDIAIEQWIDTIARNDAATAMHSRAVGAWSALVARRLGLDTDVVTFVARCGAIHDIGKVNTPVSILQANRRLTATEWAQMERHVSDGWDIVNENPILLPFANAVLHHHERFDGAGYPHGLASHAIDLTTRIVTVTDAFNAMIAERPYRKSLSPLVALEELKRHSETQFDPDCVAAMTDVVIGAAA